jgi:hypothetical protein
VPKAALRSSLSSPTYEVEPAELFPAKGLPLTLGYIVSPEAGLNKQKNAGVRKMGVKVPIRGVGTWTFKKKKYIIVHILYTCW